MPSEDQSLKQETDDEEIVSVSEAIFNIAKIINKEFENDLDYRNLVFKACAQATANLSMAF